MADYNYDAFSSEDYDFDTEQGPAVGQKAPDFTLRTSNGTARNLLDFDGDFLVLELGSITCPLFQTRRPGMAALDRDYPNVASAVLYVREAHPGALIPAHRDQADKIACAARLRHEDGETRLVLVDDLAGAAHQAYGGMPNAVFIINRHGCVVFRSDWNNAGATRKALAALVDGRPIRAKSYFRPSWPSVARMTLGRAGKGSAADFLRSLPALIWANLIKRNLRLLLGRVPTVAADMRC